MMAWSSLIGSRGRIDGGIGRAIERIARGGETTTERWSDLGFWLRATPRHQIPELLFEKPLEINGRLKRRFKVLWRD